MATSPASALLVLIAEAEPVVEVHRMRLDPVTERGVPAHVTAIYPFIARDDLDDDALDRVAAVAAGQDGFDYVFSSTAWFEGDALLYLAPNDPAPFTRLTEALAGEFPEHPPYGGVHDEVVPHLTVGLRAEGADLHAAEAAIRPGLPVAGRAEHLTLMTEDDAGRWSVTRRFLFGP